MAVRHQMFTTVIVNFIMINVSANRIKIIINLCKRTHKARPYRTFKSKFNWTSAVLTKAANVLVYSLFLIPYSSFLIPHSSFLIFHFPSPIPNFFTFNY